MAPIGNPMLSRILEWAHGSYLVAPYRDKVFLDHIIGVIRWETLSTELLEALVETYLPHDQAWPFSVVRMFCWVHELQEAPKIPEKPRKPRLTGKKLSEVGFGESRTSGPQAWAAPWRPDVTVPRACLDLPREDAIRLRL